MQTVLYMLAALAITIMWHEAAHAAFALASSRGRVVLQVGFGPAASLSVGRLELRLAPIPLGGICMYDSTDRRFDRALIAAAGPVASLLLAAIALTTRPAFEPIDHPLALLAGEVFLASTFAAILTALPIRYPGGHDSDGLAVLRALRPASRLVLDAPHVETRPERPLRPPFAVALAFCTVLAFMVSFWMGALLSAFFAFAWLGEQDSA